MARPYIICHMVTSLDGKVSGGFLEKSEYSGIIETYYQIHKNYAADGFLCGRITMAGSFPQPPVRLTKYEGAALDRNDFIAEKAAFYAVAVDPQGKLLWNDRVISDLDAGYDGAHIIEVLTEQVSDDFLAHLRSKGVSYVFGGKEKLNLDFVVRKLKSLFNIDKLLLEGGGIVNGSFLEAGLIDEISMVVIPAAEPSEKAIPLFQTSKYTSADAQTAAFRLKSAEKLDNGSLWLTYQNNQKEAISF